MGSDPLRSFRFVVAVRIILIVATALLLAALLSGPRHATSLLCCLLLAGQAWNSRFLAETEFAVALRANGRHFGAFLIWSLIQLAGLGHRFRLERRLA